MDGWVSGGGGSTVVMAFQERAIVFLFFSKVKSFQEVSEFSPDDLSCSVCHEFLILPSARK